MKIPSLLRKFGSVALAMLTALPLSAGSRRTSRNLRPRSNRASYSIKVNSDLVLTNVVVRDKKTGARGARPYGQGFHRAGKRQAAGDHQL